MTDAPDRDAPLEAHRAHAAEALGREDLKHEPAGGMVREDEVPADEGTPSEERDVSETPRSNEPTPEKTGASDAVPEADQDEVEPEQPGGPPQQANDEEAPVRETPRFEP